MNLPLITGEQFQALAEEMKLLLAKPKRAVARHVPGKMNKAEAAFEFQLKLDMQAGLVLDYRFEAVTLKLGPDCRYTPDFMVVNADGTISMIDVKAFWVKQGKPHIEDDARAKMAMATDKFPWFEFALAWQEASGWERKVIG